MNIRSNIHPFISQRIVTKYCRTTRAGRTIVPMVSIIRAIHRLAGPKDRAIPHGSCGLIRAPRIFRMRLLGRTCRRRCASTFASSTSMIRTVNERIYLIRKGERGVGLAAPFSLGVTRILV